MANTTALFPSSASNNNAVGQSNWSAFGTSPSNVLATDGTAAITRVGDDLAAGLVSNYLLPVNFSASLPVGATVVGWIDTVRIQCDGNSQAPAFSIVRPYINGVVSGANKAAATAIPTSYTDVSFGGAADTWSLSPSASDMNSATTGLVISVQVAAAGGLDTIISVDSITRTIYYTLPSNPQPENGVMYLVALIPALCSSAWSFVRKSIVAEVAT